jgi:hypothetical protein
VGFLNALRCSRPRALRLDNASPRPSHPRHPLDKKGSPQFIPNHEGRQNATRPRQYAAVSATTPTYVSFPMRTATRRRMVPHAVITHAEADGTTARRIGAPHLSLRVLASSARPSRGPDF